jgi:hypothetical protein
MVSPGKGVNADGISILNGIAAVVKPGDQMTDIQHLS